MKTIFTFLHSYYLLCILMKFYKYSGHIIYRSDRKFNNIWKYVKTSLHVMEKDEITGLYNIEGNKVN